MNTTEAAKILKRIEILYPQFNSSPISDDDVKELIEIWADSFIAESFESVATALKMHVKKSKYAPTIAELKAELIKRDNPTPAEAWQIIDKALGAYGNNIYEHLSGKVLEAAKKFRISYLGAMDQGEAQKAFMKAYTEVLYD